MKAHISPIGKLSCLWNVKAAATVLEGHLDLLDNWADTSLHLRPPKISMSSVNRYVETSLLWRNFIIFGHLLRAKIVFGNTLNLFGQIIYAFGQILILVNDQIVKIKSRHLATLSMINPWSCSPSQIPWCTSSRSSWLQWSDLRRPRPLACPSRSRTSASGWLPPLSRTFKRNNNLFVEYFCWSLNKHSYLQKYDILHNSQKILLQISTLNEYNNC